MSFTVSLWHNKGGHTQKGTIRATMQGNLNLCHEEEIHSNSFLSPKSNITASRWSHLVSGQHGACHTVRGGAHSDGHRGRHRGAQGALREGGGPTEASLHSPAGSQAGGTQD